MLEACLILPFETSQEEIKEAKVEISKRQSKSNKNYSDKASLSSVDPWYDNYFNDFTDEHKQEVY